MISKNTNRSECRNLLSDSKITEGLNDLNNHKRKRDISPSRLRYLCDYEVRSPDGTSHENSKKRVVNSSYEEVWTDTIKGLDAHGPHE